MLYIELIKGHFECMCKFTLNEFNKLIKPFIDSLNINENNIKITGSVLFNPLQYGGRYISTEPMFQTQKP